MIEVEVKAHVNDFEDVKKKLKENYSTNWGIINGIFPNYENYWKKFSLETRNLKILTLSMISQE